MLFVTSLLFDGEQTDMSKADSSKTKFFRVAVEGQSTDGRTISREWIQQMAANYSATKFGARINLEHFRGIMPDGPFKAYGDVIAVEARDLTGEFSGKLGLFAQISPTGDLIAMNKARQKIYTSIEVDPSFADTKQAYLVGLAVTDSPASLGTEILSFAAQNPAASPFAAKKQKPENLFSTAAEELVLDMEPETTNAVTAMFTKVSEMLGVVSKKGTSDDARFTDLGNAVELLATHSKEQNEAFTKQSEIVVALQAEVKELKAKAETDRTAFNDLQTKLSSTSSQSVRPTATGGAGTVQTDC